MKALTVRPGQPDSLAVTEVAEPTPAEGAVLVDAVAVGLCGTDFEIVRGEYGQAPPGEELLILGHENLGRVVEAPPGSDLNPGDLVVAIVRHPDPVPCAACAAGEWDMCLNDRYTEHGIRGLHGFARERWRSDPAELVRLDPSLGDLGVLLEPATILAKAWEQIDRIGRRAFWQPGVVVVTGAGAIGQFAMLMAAQRGLSVHVFDRNRSGPKPELVKRLGATYHTESLADSEIRADVLIECTGATPLVLAALSHLAGEGILCLTGVSVPGEKTPVDVGALGRDLVLHNQVVFGTVNANRRHYEAAATALAAADRDWLRSLISRRVPLGSQRDAFSKQPNDLKVVVDLEA